MHLDRRRRRGKSPLDGLHAPWGWISFLMLTSGGRRATCGHHSGAALTRRSLKQILTAEAGLEDTKREPDESAVPTSRDAPREIGQSGGEMNARRQRQAPGADVRVRHVDGLGYLSPDCQRSPPAWGERLGPAVSSNPLPADIRVTRRPRARERWSRASTAEKLPLFGS